MKPECPDLLIFEPQIAGHRLTWLQYITEDFLDFGYRVTLALDLRTEAEKIIRENLSPLCSRITMMSVFDEHGRWRGGSKIKSMAECKEISQARHVFVNELDDVASSVLRRAALGIYPPPSLKGYLNGIYFRPRFLSEPAWPPGNMIKSSGFHKLCNQGWFKRIYLVDECLISSQTNHNHLFHFLPDVWSGDYVRSLPEARKVLDIPLDKFVFLQYGVGNRRKGLHLVISAMTKMMPDSGCFLLCAGQIEDHLAKKIVLLEKKGVAKLMNRYVSDEEERLAFGAADVVLLPYVDHYGSSGVLSRAAAAGKMVIASDAGLLAKRVREHGLGFLFKMNNARALQNSMVKAVLLNNESRSEIQRNALRYASTCSREEFRQSLVSPWGPVK